VIAESLAGVGGLAVGALDRNRYYEIKPDGKTEAEADEERRGPEQT